MRRKIAVGAVLVAVVLAAVVFACDRIPSAEPPLRAGMTVEDVENVLDGAGWRGLGHPDFFGASCHYADPVESDFLGNSQRIRLRYDALEVLVEWKASKPSPQKEVVMRFGLSAVIVLVIGGPAFFAVAYGEPTPVSKDEAGDMEVFLADKIKWQEGPPSLPKGAQVAMLEGDPSKEGPFVLRVKLPDGYRVPPHTCPKTERITVLSGTLNIGMGEKFDEKAGKAMPAGSYGHWPAGMKHFAWAKGETVIQLHGAGPWSIQYVNAEDDPRNQKK